MKTMKITFVIMPEKVTIFIFCILTKNHCGVNIKPSPVKNKQNIEKKVIFGIASEAKKSPMIERDKKISFNKQTLVK